MSTFIQVIIIVIAVWIIFTHYINIHNKRYTTSSLDESKVTKHNLLLDVFKLPIEWIQLIVLGIETGISLLGIISISPGMSIEPQPSGLLVITDIVIIPIILFWALSEIYDDMYDLKYADMKSKYAAETPSALILMYSFHLICIELGIAVFKASGLSTVQAIHMLFAYDATSVCIAIYLFGANILVLGIAIAEVMYCSRNRAKALNKKEIDILQTLDLDSSTQKCKIHNKDY